MCPMVTLGTKKRWWRRSPSSEDGSHHSRLCGLEDKNSMAEKALFGPCCGDRESNNNTATKPLRRHNSLFLQSTTNGGQGQNKTWENIHIFVQKAPMLLILLEETSQQAASPTLPWQEWQAAGTVAVAGTCGQRVRIFWHGAVAAGSNWKNLWHVFTQQAVKILWNLPQSNFGLWNAAFWVSIQKLDTTSCTFPF